MPQKLLFISPTGTFDNGAEKSIVQLMMYLAKLGYEVHNIYPANIHETKENYLATLTGAGVLCQSLQVAKWWWPQFPVEFPFSQSQQFLAYQENLHMVRSYIREHEIELVLSNTANVFVGSIAAACEGVAHFWLIHEFPLGEFAYYQQNLPFMIEQSDSIFAVQGRLRENLQGVASEKTTIQPFIPYSPMAEQVLQSGNQRRIVSIGRLNDNKNQLELLEAYQKLGKTEVPLVFIGDWDKDYKLLCDEYIAENGLENVEFLGFQPRPWEFVTDQDICVLTSKFETFSLVFVEAVLNGVPTLVSDNLGYQSARDYLGIGEWYTLGNYEQLADSLASCLHDFSAYKSQSLSAKEKVRSQYTPENCYQHIYTAIQAVKTAKEKPLEAIQLLLGGADVAELKSKIAHRFITVQIDKGSGFEKTNQKQYPLALEDELCFVVPSDAVQIRLDLSNQPSYYHMVKLTTIENKTELFPNETNGFVVDNHYLFPESRPYILYQIPAGFQEQEVCLSYKMFDVDDLFAPDYVGNQLGRELFAKHQECLGLQEQVKLQQQNLDMLTTQYNAVINSRRWTIPTAIINFFRRGK